MRLAFKRNLRSVVAVLLASLPSGIVCNDSSAQSAANSVVTLNILVSRGEDYIAGMKATSFAVYDEGVEQNIRFFKEGAVPTSVLIVLATTEGINPYDNPIFKWVSRAVSTLESLPLGSEYSLIGADSQPRILMDWTPDVAAIRNEIAPLKAKGTQTSLYDACLVGLNKLAARTNLKRVLIIISGGVENKSRHKFDELLAVVKASDVLVYPVGLDDRAVNIYELSPQFRNEMERLARLAGGRFMVTKDSYLIGQVFRALALDLEHQYLISFEPANNLSPGSYHRVEVKFKSGQKVDRELKGLHIRSRQGYLEK